MRLRARLALACAVVAAPVLIAVGVARRDVRARTIDEVLRGHVDAWLATGPTRCAFPAPAGPVGLPVPGCLGDRELRAPADLGRVRPPGRGGPDVPRPSWFAGYDAAGRPLSGGDTPLDPAWLAAVEGRGTEISLGGPWRGRRLVRRIGPLPDGCAWVEAGHLFPPELGDDGLAPWLLAGGLAPLVVWVAMGGAVRRLRALAAAVRRSAAEGYRTPAGPYGDDEVGDLARAFDEAGAEVRARVAEVEAREQALRRFVEDTTHDLMTPLSVLQGEIVALEQAGWTGSALAAREAQYMASIVHNLSTMARLDGATEAPAPEPVDLGEVIEAVARRHAPLARRLGVALEVRGAGTPVVVTGEGTLVAQALGNLVHNAIHHNAPGGAAAIGLHLDGAGGFVVEVVDDGPGLNDDELVRAGERSWRSDAARRRDGAGSGLGLAIARRICERHGWALRLSRPGPRGLAVAVSGPLPPHGPAGNSPSSAAQD